VSHCWAKASGQCTKSEAFAAKYWEANPFDASFDAYFVKRRKEKAKKAMITHQKCVILLKK
jgi:hypothetical protein